MPTTGTAPDTRPGLLEVEEFFADPGFTGIAYLAPHRGGCSGTAVR